MKHLSELLTMNLKDVKSLLSTYTESQLYAIELEIEALNFNSSKADDILEIISELMIDFEEIDYVAEAFSTMFY